MSLFDLEQFFSNPNENYLISSKSETFFTDDCMIGIDEAGRGPVLGPLVYAAAYYPLSFQKEIEKENFQDSKTLTEKERSRLFEIINKYGIGWYAAIISPTLISNSMLKRSKYNLNALSHDTAISLIQKCLDESIKVKEIYLDTVGPADKYETKLKQLFPNIKKIKVSNKADSLYKVVSVASICAKFIRDYIIKNWKFVENFSYNETDYGSGYPSDPKTKEFLRKIFDPIFGFPTLARFSWSTISKLMDEKAIFCSWDDDEEDEINNGNSIIDFFKKNNVAKQVKSSSFFIDRNIDQVESVDVIFN